MLISANLKYRMRIPVLFESEEIYVPLKYFVRSVYIYYSTQTFREEKFDRVYKNQYKRFSKIFKDIEDNNATILRKLNDINVIWVNLQTLFFKRQFIQNHLMLLFDEINFQSDKFKLIEFYDNILIYVLSKALGEAKLTNFNLSNEYSKFGMDSIYLRYRNNNINYYNKMKNDFHKEMNILSQKEVKLNNNVTVQMLKCYSPRYNKTVNIPLPVLKFMFQVGPLILKNLIWFNRIYKNKMFLGLKYGTEELVSYDLYNLNIEFSKPVKPFYQRRTTLLHPIYVCC